MSRNSFQRDVIVLGGGAAGLLCAIEAGKRGRSVLVLEHAERVGKKIAISGGGRCNFTNLNTRPENFLSANPSFVKSALARYTPQDFIALVEKHRIAYHEKKLGQLFCDGSSREIIGMLVAECDAAGVEIRLQCKVRKVSKDSSFKLETDRGEFEARSLVIATGGLSIAPLGATDFGYRIARQFGLVVREPRPALVPLTFAARKLEELKALSGVSIDALVAANGAEFRENVLLTHRGLSGPAILQISSYWRPGDAIHINLLPDLGAKEMLLSRRRSEMELANLLGLYLPRRFAQAWCGLYAPSRPLSRYSNRELEEIAHRIQDWRLVPDGSEGYKKAEVTAGGVDTRELSSRTMEAGRVAGLYFIGEVVDVTGQLGGYNFQWAWASGYAAGQYA
ncbi:MAG TPA: NAD(P)/FAD-dependent oxidoreductase [Pyrinomonadaceae bacterium]|jgi:predicted Rossmann fold flavoprotein|nr:NAD(P)/FAD-dependent oxidoreductase [Pyrinomonadaceae bacterium]